MFRLLPFALPALVLALTPACAQAAQGSISIPASALAPNTGADNNGRGLQPPPTGVTGGFISFVLPRDYKSGTVVKLRLTMYTDSLAACAVYLFPRQVLRMRPGKRQYSGLERFTTVGGPLASSPTSVTVITKTFELRGPLAATFTGQKPGDSFLIEVGRDSDEAADTCNNLFIRNAEARYTRK
jgi:hypothetical protein